MKIVYLTNVRLPTEKAHGLQIMKMCEAFSARKDQGNNQCEVELHVPRRLNPIKGNAYDYYNVRRSFDITRVPCLDLTSFGFGYIGYWIQMVTFLLSAKVILLFKKYDFLYTREFAVSLLFRNCILEIHDMPKKITRWHLRAWQNAKKIIVLTRYLKEELGQQGIDVDKIWVSPDGVDLAEFDIAMSKAEARKKFLIPESKKVVMYTGSFFLYSWKGVDTLIEAAKELSDNILVVLVGGGEKEIRDLKSKYRLDNVMLIGRQKHEEIPILLRAADVLVLPNKSGDSNSERYTSPLKLFEYMASGVPIVASDLPSLREILNEKNCTFFVSGDATSLGGAIKLVLNNPEVSGLKAEQAHKDVQECSWEKRSQSILQFLKKE